MIKQLLLAALLVTPMAHANERAGVCEKVGNMAVKIYDGRQGMVAAEDAFKSVEGLSDYWFRMVHEAYTMPRWNTKHHRDNNRVDFKSKWVMWCYLEDK